MAEFEPIPELTRTLNVTNAALGGLVKAQLLSVDGQYLDAQIPLLYMGRYKETYQLVLQQRARLEAEQQVARRSEMAAQRNVEIAQNSLLLSPVGGAGGHVNSQSHPHASHSSTSSSGSSTTSSASSNGSTISSPTSLHSNGSSSNGINNTNIINISERNFNQAKLDLAAAEDAFEQRRAAADQMTSSLRGESVRLEGMQKAQLMVS